jgi:hypothetical protein
MSYSPLPQTGRSAGIVTTAELRAAGKSKYEIETLARDGTLIRLRYGVYADATRADRYAKQGAEHLLQAAAALAVVGADATVSHQSAARLHDIDLLGKASNTVTLTCPPQHGWRGRAGVKVHTADLPVEHLDTKVRFRMTTPARTVVDLARTLDDFKAGVVTADSALHKKLATKDELHAVLAACPRWRGIQRARQVVAFADDRAESPLESIARLVFANCGLPAPDLQVWLTEQITGRLLLEEVPNGRRGRRRPEVRPRSRARPGRTGAGPGAPPGRLRGRPLQLGRHHPQPAVRCRLGSRSLQKGNESALATAVRSAAAHKRLTSRTQLVSPLTAVIIRFSDTGPVVPSTCANRLTRSSSISQRTATTSGRARSVGGSSASADSYAALTRWTIAIRSASRLCSPASLSSRLVMARR